MAVPIFVIGRDRSGTKWLSNIIASHKDVACIQHRDHFGILEARDILVAAPVLFGDISIPENFIAFLESFSQTDFFRLTGLDKDYFYKSRPLNYLSFFRLMMDRFAENQGKQYWVQKSNVLTLDDLYRHFPNGKFVIIIRNLKDNIKSKIGQRIREGAKDTKKNLVQGTIRYFICIAEIRKFSNYSNVHVIRYEDLKKDKKTVMQSICEFLKIEFDEAMLQDRFIDNTSFKNGVSRDSILTNADLLKIDLLTFSLKFLPRWVYDQLSLRSKRIFKRELLEPSTKRFLSLKLQKKNLGWD